MAAEKTVYLKIKAYMEANKIVKTQVFKEAGLNATKTCNILKGKRNLTAEEYIAICKVLKVSSDTFAD